MFSILCLLAFIHHEGAVGGSLEVTRVWELIWEEDLYITLNW